jgi:hypothetical protein
MTEKTVMRVSHEYAETKTFAGENGIAGLATSSLLMATAWIAVAAGLDAAVVAGVALGAVSSAILGFSASEERSQ